MLPPGLLALRQALLCQTTASLVPRWASALGVPPMAKPVEASIRAKLRAALDPVHLEVMDDSHLHAVPRGAETHFRVLVASQSFQGLPLIHRHRLVNEILQEELSGPVHALSIQAKTPEQWEKNPQVARPTACLGGSKHGPRGGAKAEEPGKKKEGAA